MINYKLNKEQRIQKRVFDILVSSIAIIFSFPIMVIIFIIVKIDSKGPGIFKQKRITKDGKEFTMYKFRTMINNAEKDTRANTCGKRRYEYCRSKTREN